MAPEECDSGLGQSAPGVIHVGLLRAGAARQVVAALADGQVLFYRENGEEARTNLFPHARCQARYHPLTRFRF